jgi:hypothetical protein
MKEPFEDVDAAALAAALRDDHDALCQAAHVPPAGLVFWRSTIRARAEAARIAERPITLVQSLATTFVIALALALVGAVWQAMPDVIAQHALVLVLGVALCLLVAPIAVFVALGD